MNQKGIAHILLLIAAIGLIAFILISSSAPFKDRLFNILFPKPASHAQEIDLRDKTNRLLQAIKEYKQAPTNNRSTKAQHLVEISNDRKALMSEMALTNPDSFIRNTLPTNITNSLPTVIRANIENEVNLEGNLTVLISDNFEGHTSKTTYKIDKYQLFFARGQIPSMLTGDKARVKGYALGETLVIDLGGNANNFSVTSANNQVLGASTNGQVLAKVATQKKIAVVPINFTSLPNENVSVDQLRRDFFDIVPTKSVHTYFQENSYGKLTFTGDVYNWKTINYDILSSTCDFNLISRLANDANLINEANYDHIFYVFPKISSCNWNGLGEVGGKHAWSNGRIDLYAYTHEIGHNFGLRHSASLTCGPKAIDAYEQCLINNSGDYFDIMSNDSFVSIPHLNAVHKNKVSWNNVLNVTRNGTYTISPHELALSSNQAISIPIGQGPRITEYYFLEYRQPIGFDTEIKVSGNSNNFINNAASGVSINLLRDFTGTNQSGTITSDSQLLKHPQIKDPTTNNPPGYTLLNNDSFIDEINGIKIKQISHNSNGATVEITFGSGQCAEHEPIVGITSNNNVTYPGGIVTYTVTVQNNDSTACPSRQFNLDEVVPNGWAGIFSPNSLNLTPGQVGSATLTVDSADNSQGGLYDVTVTAASATNASLDDSEIATFIIDGSIQPPTQTPSPVPTPTPTVSSPTPTATQRCRGNRCSPTPTSSPTANFQYLYVVDTFFIDFQNSTKLQKFNLNGNFISKIVEIPKSQIQGVSYGLTDTATDPDGNIWVTSHGSQDTPAEHRSVRKYSPEGSLLLTIGPRTSSLNDMPFSIDVDKNGIVYIANGGTGVGTDQEAWVRKYTKDGQFLAQFGSRGSEDGQFYYGDGIAVDDRNGDIYIADRQNRRVSKFDNNGNFIRKFGSFGFNPGQFANGPDHIAIDSQGFVFVTDGGQHKVSKFTPDGSFVTWFGSYGTGQGQFINVVGIDIDSQDNIWIGDYYNNRIQVYSKTFSFIKQFGTEGTADGQFTTPWGIALGK